MPKRSHFPASHLLALLLHAILVLNRGGWSLSEDMKKAIL